MESLFTHRSRYHSACVVVVAGTSIPPSLSFRMTSPASRKKSKLLRGVDGLISDIVYPMHQHGCSAALGLEATVSPSKDGPNNCLESKLCPFYFLEDSPVRERARSGTSAKLCSWLLRRSADSISSRTRTSPTLYWGTSLERWWRSRYAGGSTQSSQCKGCLFPA